MARLLEEVSPGTPVFDRQGAQIGEIRGVYGSGEGLLAEFVLVFWTNRDAQALVAADEVAQVTDQGVTLIGSSFSYDGLPAFDPSSNPALHRL